MQQTALIEEHRAAGARLVDFAGWEMPVQYAGILEEHRAVRERAGLFDLSHMGEVWLTGPGAGQALAFALVTDPPRLANGRAHYSMIAAADGGLIDDLIVYRLADERFLVVPNAANREAVVAALRQRLTGFDAQLDDASLRTSLVAIQGPLAAGILQPLTTVDLGPLKYYAIAEGSVAGIPALVARTGYTGEDGFEIFVEWTDGVPLWQALRDAGQGRGLRRAQCPREGQRLRAAAKPGWPGRSRPSDRTSRPPGNGAGQRPADGRGDQRRAVTNARHAHRHGVRPAAVGRGRYHGGNRHSRWAGRRRNRPVAVLQAFTRLARARSTSSSPARSKCGHTRRPSIHRRPRMAARRRR
jgi:heterotetrameric sarcosine oxidase gamma subunit